MGKLFQLESRQWILVLLGTVIAIWPSLIWYQARMSDGSDNNWGLLALLTAFIITVTKRSTEDQAQRPQVNFKLLNGLLLIYIIFLFLNVYPLLQAASAALLLACILSHIHGGNKLNYGLTGLMILSLPLFASLDFYLGYPLRYFVGLVSSALLHLQGLNVSLEGVKLIMADQVIIIDGPCSGIKMMWTASFLVSSFVALFNLSLKQSIKLGLLSFCFVLIANILRVTALFYLESGLLKNLQWMHEYVGLVCYGLAVLVTVYFGLQLASQKQNISRQEIKA